MTTTTNNPIIVRDRTPIPFRIIEPGTAPAGRRLVIAGGVKVGEVPIDPPETIIDRAAAIVDAAVAKDRIHAWSPLGDTPERDPFWDEEDDAEIRAGDIAGLERRIAELKADISRTDMEIDELESDLSERRSERRDLIVELRDVKRELEEIAGRGIA